MADTTKDHQENETSCSDESKWGFEPSQLYLLAVKFYKEKEGKALQLSYASRLQFAALGQQAAHGPCRPESLPQLGVLDVVGRDRREAWRQLGSLARPQAMLRYIEALDAACPIFRPFAEAHQRDLETRRRRGEEERAAEEARCRAEETERRQREREDGQLAETKRFIQDALNRQTFLQFRAYACQQYPGNPEQQAVLIRRLQQQHYQQYMQQLFQHRRQPPAALERPASDPGADIELPVSSPDADIETAEDCLATWQTAESTSRASHLPKSSISEATDDDATNQAKDEPDSPLTPARLWTRGDLTAFKAARLAEGRGSAVLTVGQGQVATVRVPTREDGSCLFWEFATDGFDLGFGVSYEWGPQAQREVTVEVGDPEEEEGEERGEEEGEGPVLEVPGRRYSCLVPVYRRDCHLQVYAGSHHFPAREGAYLLKFDNSYSLWRAKTLYYRVFYTR